MGDRTSKRAGSYCNEPNLTIDEKVPSLCLKLSLAGQSLTDADKKLIRTALAAAGVKATFCGS